MKKISKEEKGGYVSRGGIKLEAALEAFHIDPIGKIALDVGASTGGFSDCLLKKGALKVYTVDVGYGILAWPLRKDPRVVVLERRNIRYLSPEEIPKSIDIATVDLSFISLTKVLPKIASFLKENGEIIALVKPQFEAKKEDVEKGGLVKDPKKHTEMIEKIKAYSKEIGFTSIEAMESPILGRKGNKEFFLYLKKEGV